MANDGSIKTPWLSRLITRKPKNREQIIALLRDAKYQQLIDEHALHMLEGVLQVSEMQVRDVMIPRSQMVTIDAEAPLDEIQKIVIESGHSRFPVVGEHHDEIIGVLLAKDLLAHTQENADAKLRDIVRPIVFIPKSKHLNQLLQEFRSKHLHMAMVIDEYGGVAGLVTIEDVLEQIVGDIEDEHDFDDEAYIKKHSDTRYIIKALTPVEEFNHYFHSHLSDHEFDTIGGVVLNAFGHLPKRGESITLESFRFKVLRADSRRIHLLRLTRKASS